ncbi:hypothetical protein EDD18DRAFT_1105233 [Armillaria luteobubalina]|uniref:Uncharacterized protein n=1 Tax=Armillaria luteobubalina TaxID=153913 RepID=A0AA39UPG2_9AGAR|nr:hypothetical protein EDD18DRAFT_1105233 [Armillaria luteobubalina]
MMMGPVLPTGAEFNPLQKNVIRNLLTSLYAALKVLNVDGKKLLEECQGSFHPLKLFLMVSLPDFITQSLADPMIEKLCDEACNNAMAHLDDPVDHTMTNIFNGEFIKTFKGPAPGKLFIDRGEKVHIAYAMQVDFYNPNGIHKQGNHNSIGLISMANLNIPKSIRYKPENIFVAGITPGLKEPNYKQMPHLMAPLMDICMEAWHQGLYISRIKDILSVNDLPAAHRVLGMQLTRLPGAPFVNRTRNHTKQAEAWHDAMTCKAKEIIFKKYGGLVHYHGCYIVAIDKEAAKKLCKLSPAFLYEWVPYNCTVLPEPINDLSKDQEKDISGIHHILELPLAGDGSITLDTLRKRLSTKSWASLMFVCATVSYRDLVNDTAAMDVVKLATDKIDFVDHLIQWHLEWVPVDLNALAYIQHIIKETITPSWINSVPSKYGKDSAGSIKADKWRTLSTVYLPLALVMLWGDNDGQEPDPSSYLLQVLDHTMALFQAVIIVCKYTMTTCYATLYHKFMKKWADGLFKIHPHTKVQNSKPNIHPSFHLYDFLLLFGAVYSWWTFPFECLIGTLQKINTNDHIDSMLEATVLQSFMKGANL